MKKTTRKAAAASDGKLEFRIRPGVDWINGRRVDGAATVRLTAAEAAYDLGLSRISPADRQVPNDWPSGLSGGGDGGN